MLLVSLIIPAYNEAARIQTTMSEAIDYFASRGISCEIIVSADGDDGTREAARELAAGRVGGAEIQVIGSARRGGKGLGIREGVRVSRGDIIGFVDADNKTPITEFDKIRPHLDAGHDVVIGSRGLGGSRIERPQPWFRRVGSKGFRYALSATVGLTDIVDTQCGFKFFQGHVARDLFERQQIDGYMFDVEVLFLAQQLRYSIAQVPVRWRDDADSRLDLVVGNLRNARDVLSIRWRHRSAGRSAAARVPTAFAERYTGDVAPRVGTPED
jgi:dolichyl-phosphate beta-glucosyltransferase